MYVYAVCVCVHVRKRDNPGERRDNSPPIYMYKTRLLPSHQSVLRLTANATSHCYCTIVCGCIITTEQVGVTTGMYEPPQIVSGARSKIIDYSIIYFDPINVLEALYRKAFIKGGAHMCFVDV